MSAGRIPQAFIDEVLLRTDIVDLIDARVKLKRAGKNYAACCPFHQEKSPSFTVNREKQFYYCFGCGASGNALSFLIEHDRLEFMDGLKQLAGQAGMTLPETREAGNSSRDTQQPLYDALESAAQFFEQQLRQAPARDRAVSYLKKRGVTGAVAKHFRLGYAPPGWDNLLQNLGQDPVANERLLQAGLLIRNEQRNSVYDALRDRVIFPIRDFRGRVIAFGGRVLNDDKPKYLNSPESPVFHKGQELYGLYEARQSGKLSRLLVVEGYMDVVALAQNGIPEAVATLGTATSTTHIERLFRVVSDVVFCFDGDNAGRRAAWRALENALPALKDGVSARFLFLPDGEDPDSLVRREGPELFRARIEADSVPLTEQLFRHLSEGITLTSLEGRSKLANEALPLLALVPESLFKTLLLQRLSELTELSVDVIEKQLNQRAVQKVAQQQQAAVDTTQYRAQPPATTSDSQSSDEPYWAHGPDEDADAMAWLHHEDQQHANPPKFGARKGTFGETKFSRNDKKQPFTPRRERTQPPALRSLSAQTIRLLLQAPKLAARWPEDLLLTLDDPESSVLHALLHDLQRDPDRSLAALLGSWHGTPEGDALAAIAAEAWLLTPADPEIEARHLTYRLRLRALELEADRLNKQLQHQPDRSILQALTDIKRQHAELQRQAASEAST